MQKPEDFTRFYYNYVGQGEACGCAEKVIDVYEFNRKAGAAVATTPASPMQRPGSSVVARGLRRFLGRFRATS